MSPRLGRGLIEYASRQLIEKQQRLSVAFQQATGGKKPIGRPRFSTTRTAIVLLDRGFNWRQICPLAFGPERWKAWNVLEKAEQSGDLRRNVKAVLKRERQGRKRLPKQ